MTKKSRGEVLNRLQSVSRLARTRLAMRLLDHGFYAGQDQIMLALDERDDLTPGVLASQLGIRPPTVTKTIGRLQNQGFVSKSSSGTDQRQKHIRLTESGRQAIANITRAIRKTEKQVLKNLDRKERKQLRKLLMQLETGLQSQDPVA